MEKNNDYKVFTPFVLKRLSGAEAIAKSSKAKGGASMLTYEHYNAKLPIYKAARAKFDVEKSKKEFSDLQTKLSYNMGQNDFQVLMGQLEVLGELIIKHEADQKEKMPIETKTELVEVVEDKPKKAKAAPKPKPKVKLKMYGE
jgi:hypothetical protein